MKKPRAAWFLVFVILAATAFAATDPAFERAQKKMDLLEAGQSKRGSVVMFSPAEINAWARGKAPQGVRESRIELDAGTVRGFAMVDLAQIRQVQESIFSALVTGLLAGEHPVEVAVRMESERGKCTVFLTSVQFDGAIISQSVLSFLIKTFFHPMFPDAKIGQPFQLREPIERLEARPDGFRVYVKK